MIRVEVVMGNNNRMCDLPADERPYEKCIKYGAKALSDAELLAAILRTGAKGEKSVDLARNILQLSKSCNGILGIYHSSIEELMQIKGVGKVKAVQIKCVAELSKRFNKAMCQERLSFDEPYSIAQYYMEELRHEECERLLLLMLDTKNGLIKDTVISIGTVNASLVSPRELFIEALKAGAVNIILLHNHPSGDASASREDIILTKQIGKCGNLLGIKLLDHIIIGDNKYMSFREQKMLGDE